MKKHIILSANEVDNLLDEVDEEQDSHVDLLIAPDKIAIWLETWTPEILKLPQAQQVLCINELLDTFEVEEKNG